MDQQTRLEYLINTLFEERQSYNDYYQDNIEIKTYDKGLLRELFNQRPALAVSDDFLQIQDEYLQAENEKRPSLTITDLKPIPNEAQLYLFQGDITSLAVDAIVNAANSDMRGCFIPRHQCIDNIIHTRAGVQLRLACDELMQTQGKKEPVGKSKITAAYNLPSKYIIHTVGPHINGQVSAMKRDLLAKCYHESLKLADENNLSEIAFCCISTGEFHFPNDQAAEIAIATVRQYLAETQSSIKVIFNVFKDEDLRLYQEKLSI